MSTNKEMFEQDYEAPTKRETLVDIEAGKVVKFEEVSPMDAIKALATKYKWNICDPEPGCNKCYGRGYTGKDISTGAPIACRCLFRKRTPQQKKQDNMMADAHHGLNRDKRRKMQSYMHKKIEEFKRNNPNYLNEATADVVKNLAALSANLMNEVLPVEEDVLKRIEETSEITLINS
jgi:hypothetical protein